MRIDHPDQLCPGLEPLGDFGEEFSWSVIRGHDLGQEIGREGGVSAIGNLVHAPLREKRDIGSAHRVGIRLDLESCILREDDAQSVSAYEVGDEVSKSRSYSPMPGAGRLTHQQPSSNELGGLTRQVEVLELFRRHEFWNRWRGHGHTIVTSTNGIKPSAE